MPVVTKINNKYWFEDVDTDHHKRETLLTGRLLRGKLYKNRKRLIGGA